VVSRFRGPTVALAVFLLDC